MSNVQAKDVASALVKMEIERRMSALTSALTGDSPTRPALLNAEQSAREVYNVSERTFHAMRNAGLVPAPIVLGPRMLRWSRAELEAAVAAMPRQTEPAPAPAQLQRGRRSGKGGAA